MKSKLITDIVEQGDAGKVFSVDSSNWSENSSNSRSSLMLYFLLNKNVNG